MSKVSDDEALDDAFWGAPQESEPEPDCGRYVGGMVLWAGSLCPNCENGCLAQTLAADLTCPSCGWGCRNREAQQGREMMREAADWALGLAEQWRKERNPRRSVFIIVIGDINRPGVAAFSTADAAEEWAEKMGEAYFGPYERLVDDGD